MKFESVKVHVRGIHNSVSKKKGLIVGQLTNVYVGGVRGVRYIAWPIKSTQTE